VAKGIKIVVVDSPLPEGLANTFVRYDQKSLGEAVARYAAGLIKDGDEVATLRANTIGNHQREGESDHRHVKGSLSQREIVSRRQGTLGMMKASKEKKLAGKVQHVGFGVGLPDEVVAAIETGVMQGWIAQEPRMFGVKGIDAAVDLSNGTKVPPVIDIEYQIVTKANLNDPKVQALKN
jgi:ribose transport system substrate-binding protein